MLTLSVNQSNGCAEGDQDGEEEQGPSGKSAAELPGLSPESTYSQMKVHWSKDPRWQVSA